MNDSLTILIVEDNPGDARLIQVLIAEENTIHCNFQFAKTLSEALIILSKSKIDLILLDLGLPDSQGIETFRKIKNHILYIPIIILSGLLDQSVALECLKEGAQDYLSKGEFDGKTLSRTIAFSMERKNILNKFLKYAAVIEASTDAIYGKDLNGVVTLWNKNAEKLYGYTAEEMIGQNISKIIPENLKNESSQLIKMIQSGKLIESYATNRVTKSGVVIDVIINAAPVFDDLKNIIGISIVSRDVSKIKDNEEILAIQLRIMKSLSESVDLNSAAHNVLKTICEILSWPVGEIFAIDQHDRVLRCVSIWHTVEISPEFEEINNSMTFHLGEDLPGYVWKQGETVWLTDLNQFSLGRQLQKLHPNKLKNCLGFPIVYKNEVLGIFLFFNDDKYELNIKFKFMFASLGGEMGVFIKRKRMEGDLLFLAEHDTLTGLANRKKFEINLAREITESQYTNKKVAILFLDLDFFKNVNDSLGHEAGDILLQVVAKKLKNSVRELDTVARFGGDEFAILLPDVMDLEIVQKIATTILNSIAKPINIKNHEIFVTASLGISIYPSDGKTPQKLLRKADRAMYAVKESGRNNYQFSHDLQGDNSRKSIFLETEVHHAIYKKEFVLYYQPIVEVATMDVVGIEALIRWHRDDGKILLPDQFIPAISQSKLIVKIGDWVLQTASEQFARWGASSLKFVSINLSVQQFSKDLIPLINDIISNTKINPKQIILEIVESTVMTHSEMNIDLIDQLKRIGVSISIDDFGTGYSSLAYIKYFKIDMLKIDQSFIQDLPDNPNAIAIVSAIIAMSKALNITVLAEGVETKEQLDFLKEKGCDLFQGFYFSKPMPEERLIAFLEKIQQ